MEQIVADQFFYYMKDNSYLKLINAILIFKANNMCSRKFSI